jgi:hypothetical protein
MKSISLAEDGSLFSIEIWKNREILDGHGRYGQWYIKKVMFSSSVQKVQ